VTLDHIGSGRAAVGTPVGATLSQAPVAQWTERLPSKCEAQNGALTCGNAPQTGAIRGHLSAEIVNLMYERDSDPMARLPLAESGHSVGAPRSRWPTR